MTMLRDRFSSWGRRPQAPGIYRIPARMTERGGRSARPPLIPAAESALGLRPRSALSSAQVLPEWITSTSPCNDLSANGGNPLTSCLTPGVQFIHHLYPPYRPATHTRKNRLRFRGNQPITTQFLPFFGPQTEGDAPSYKLTRIRDRRQVYLGFLSLAHEASRVAAS